MLQAVLLYGFNQDEHDDDEVDEDEGDKVDEDDKDDDDGEYDDDDDDDDGDGDDGWCGEQMKHDALRSAANRINATSWVSLQGMEILNSKLLNFGLNLNLDDDDVLRVL